MLSIGKWIYVYNKWHFPSVPLLKQSLEEPTWLVIPSSLATDGLVWLSGLLLCSFWHTFDDTWWCTKLTPTKVETITSTKIHRVSYRNSITQLQKNGMWGIFFPSHKLALQVFYKLRGKSSALGSWRQINKGRSAIGSIGKSSSPPSIVWTKCSLVCHAPRVSNFLQHFAEWVWRCYYTVPQYLGLHWHHSGNAIKRPLKGTACKFI